MAELALVGSGINQYQVKDAIFKGGWSQGEDLGDLSTLICLLKKQHIDGENLSKQVYKLKVKNLLIMFLQLESKAIVIQRLTLKFIMVGNLLLKRQ